MLGRSEKVLSPNKKVLSCVCVSELDCEDEEKLDNVESIYAVRIGISQLPENFQNFHAVTYVSLIGNKLEDIDYLCQLQNLGSLHVDRNKIKRIPRDITLLKNLQDFTLNDNCVTFIPTEVCKLKNLRMFLFSNNQVSLLPAQLANLTKLQVFGCSDNKNIPSLPAGSVKDQLSFITNFFGEYDRARSVALLLIWSKKNRLGILSQFPKEIVLQIAKLVFNSTL